MEQLFRYSKLLPDMSEVLNQVHQQYKNFKLKIWHNAILKYLKKSYIHVQLSIFLHFWILHKKKVDLQSTDWWLKNWTGKGHFICFAYTCNIKDCCCTRFNTTNNTQHLIPGIQNYKNSLTFEGVTLNSPSLTIARTASHWLRTINQV